MEKLMRGSEIETETSAYGKTGFCDFAIMVRKGHPECGDSAFVYSDGEKVVAAVFDGVSGEPGAAFASSDAAEAVLGFLKGASSPSAQSMEEALTKAHLAIRIGYTTVTLLHMQKDGTFVIASIGDSPAYSIGNGGKISMELPLDRAVKDGDSKLKYFYYRNMVTTVLGGQMELSFHMREGKLEKGQVLIIATDGLSDNLYLKAEAGYVMESSGTEDLRRMLGKLRSPRAILSKLARVMGQRMAGATIEEPGRMMVPKEDDLAMAVVRKI